MRGSPFPDLLRRSAPNRAVPLDLSCAASTESALLPSGCCACRCLAEPRREKGDSLPGRRACSCAPRPQEGACSPGCCWRRRGPARGRAGRNPGHQPSACEGGETERGPRARPEPSLHRAESGTVPARPSAAILLLRRQGAPRALRAAASPAKPTQGALRAALRGGETPRWGIALGRGGRTGALSAPTCNPRPTLGLLKGCAGPRRLPRPPSRPPAGVARQAGAWLFGGA